MKKTVVTAVAVLLLTQLFAAASCNVSSADSNESQPKAEVDGTSGKDVETMIQAPTVEGIRYTDLEIAGSAISAWEYENNLSNQACKNDGIIVSPYFTMTANGTEIPVFSARTARGAHSFAYIDVSDIDESGKFFLDLEILPVKERKNPVVLPESAGVAASSDGGKITAQITEFGSFTFTFDKGTDKNGTTQDGSAYPLTVMVKEKEKLEIPEGYTVREFEPGEYKARAFALNKPNTVYYFKAGKYTFDCLQIGSDCIVYFENGVLFTAKPLTLGRDGKPSTSTIFTCYNQKNVKIIGRPAVDMSYMYEGKTTMFTFEKVENLEIAGITSVNAGSWTFCLTNCTNVKIRDLLILAYRTCSDGVMLSDCSDVTVSGCFVRTGDDAMEVKSTSSGSVRTKDVVFMDNAVWTDKGIAYGAVYESNFDQSNVVWKNCSVGYALASWSPHLGCTTISMAGNKPQVSDHHMYFENIEIYMTYCPIATVVLHNGGQVHDIYWKNITVKQQKLNSGIFKSSIGLIVFNDDGGPASDFSIGDLYFDNIRIGETDLTQENAESVIRTSFAAKGVAFERENIKINTQEK